jgi:hypothetical protein
MTCIKDRDAYALQGDSYSRDYRYLEIKLLKCNPKTSKVPCKGAAEIDAFFEP